MDTIYVGIEETTDIARVADITVLCCFIWGDLANISQAKVYGYLIQSITKTAKPMAVNIVELYQ